MKCVVALLLAIPLIWADDERVCYRGAARVLVDPVDRDIIAYGAVAREQTCYSSESGCGAVRKFGVSRQYDPETETFPTDLTVGYSSLDVGCVRPGICEAITGDADGACRWAQYSYVRYEPQSCNASRAYDADYFLQTIKLYYGCCQGEDKCVDADRANNDQTALESTCTENEALGTYLRQLQACWQVGSEVFRRYFVCGDGADIYDYRSACLNDNGEWDRSMAPSDRSSTTCYYRRTCSPALLTLIKTFARCACTKAKANGFTGRAIAQFMESNFNDYCPNIDISCDADNEYAPYVRRRLKRRIIKLRIKRKIADLDEDERASLRTKMCQYLRRDCSDDDDEETVTVTATAASDEETATSSRTRRRMEDVDSENYSDVSFAIVGDYGFDDAIATAACSAADILTGLGDTATGGEADVLSCDSDDEYIDEEGTDPDATPAPTVTPESGAFMIGNGFAFIMAVFGYIMQ